MSIDPVPEVNPVTVPVQLDPSYQSNQVTEAYNGINNNSIIQSSGYYGPSWPSAGLVIPQSLSVGGWTLQNRGLQQQTFLGASVRSFSMNGGFGDTSSTLSVELINDEFNRSDATPQGLGDDVYHNGVHDQFAPPIAGSPVFFKFGANLATVEQTYRKTFDDLYNNGVSTYTGVGPAPFPFPTYGDLLNNPIQSLPNNNFVDTNTGQAVDLSSYLAPGNDRRGENHIVFGGILQSYLQNRGSNGNPLFSVQVVDPREILSNAILIFNNYAGSVYGTQNIINLYGFLEYNASQETIDEIKNLLPESGVLKKTVHPTSGTFVYTNNDTYYSSKTGSFGSSNTSFPITGTGFARRSTQGMPFYRVSQAIKALMEIDIALPQEYKNNSFGGKINFRGYNYVVDFSGLPALPPFYFIDFDQISILDFCLEICDVVSRDLFVTLLPIIDHPACQYIYDYNKSALPQDIIAGIIRVDSIDRSKPPRYGAIKSFLDNLLAMGVEVENQDVGYELSNITTDKFVVGAQEVDMYCFSANADRDFVSIRKRRGAETDAESSPSQWRLSTQLEQQILPYYGTLGKNAVTIPKGWGSYQQILLDTTGLNAQGVGAYYVATEMELRCASISYECWKDFLKQYNDTYLESIEDSDVAEGAALSQTPSFANVPVNISNNYAVTVPRSVFDTYVSGASPFDEDELPKSPCNPPYGYPLYYKRMSRLGIPEGGLTTLQSAITHMIDGVAMVRGADGSNYQDIKEAQLNFLEDIVENYAKLTPQEKQYYDEMKKALDQSPPNIALLNEIEESLHKINVVLPRLAKKGTENALKVYNFLKKIADENLGKKFLVKIPNKVNLKYSNEITWNSSPQYGEYSSGPFGFKPRAFSSIPGFEFTSTFTQALVEDYNETGSSNFIKGFLNGSGNPIYNKYGGALRANFNPISDKYEYNYSLTNLGGYLPFELYENTLTKAQIESLPDNVIPKAVNQMLIPQDATNFLNEDGRLSAYVRFDHSQHLDFSHFNSEDFTQQLITAKGMVPDLCEFLDNVHADNTEFESYEAADDDRQDNDREKPQQCSFIKCTVDDNFYMPPKTKERSISVYGQVGDPRIKASKPRKIFVPCSGWKNNVPGDSPEDLVPGTGVFISSFRFLEMLYTPNIEAGEPVTTLDFDRKFQPALNSNIIKTEIEDLDTDHVYALITLPGKAIPTKDSRFRDAINQKDNAYSVKHYLTMDVVKGLPEFSEPAFCKGPDSDALRRDIGCKTFSAEARSIAWLASKKAKASLQFALPQQVQMSSPSPVYPDLVVLPLISNDRCYGPWISSQLDTQAVVYSKVGGRIEFSKDENLAPWNYAGYQLMQDAGRIQAEFSNSLMLLSERGGFVVPTIPSGSLGKALIDGGPIITSMQVDVSEGGLKTTYKLDLYTASFGKLQKQKQDLISKISRERQRSRDERNALIRKGIGKAQTSVNIVGAVNMFASEGIIPNQPILSDHIVASVVKYETSSYAPALGVFGGNFGSAGSITTSQSSNSVSMQPETNIYDTANRFDSNIQREQAMYNTGASRLSDLYVPFSNEPFHSNIAHNHRTIDFRAINRLCEDENFTINDDEFTPPA
jgi:hypothetical protein